jgi:hypothetical protein
MTGLLLLAQPLLALQVPIPGREHAEIKRIRPAEIHLAHSTLATRVAAVDPAAANLAPRLKRVVTNGVIGANRTLREVAQGAQVLIECSITRYYFAEKVEEKKMLMLKDKGKFRIVNANLEVSYKVIRAKDNYVYFANNFSAPLKDEFQEGVQTAPGKEQVEDRLMQQVIASILTKLTNTEETHKVRLMGKSDLGRYARLAQGGQWPQYIESVSSLMQEKKGKALSEFEGDAYYNISVAYEALAYDQMWKDYSKAGQYFDKADEFIRKAQRTDPREKEYVNAQTRLLVGKKYFDTIKERFPKDSVTATNPVKPPPGTITNEYVITLVKGGLSDDIIISQIKEAKTKRFDTSAAALVNLKNAGASEEVIRTVLESAKSATPAGRRRN